MKMLETLKELSLLPGISGQEDAVRAYICNRLDTLDCTYTIDPLGNVLVTKKGKETPKNKLYFSSHMDEVGFIVTGIEKDGYLKFATVGGIDPRVIFGKAVEVGKNRIPGVIGGKPVHLTKGDEEQEPPSPDKLVIDIGATSKEEAEKYVSLGDMVVYYAPFLEFGRNSIVGKAFDDRAGCAMLLDILEEELPYDCYFGFTVQEEIGCTGGETAAYTINPDIGIVVESTTASDIGGVEEANQVCRQGKGPVLSFKDRGACYDLELYRRILELAEHHNIPCQTKEGVFGGNEAHVIQTAQNGSRICGISLPTRYIHSPSNVLQIDDIVATRNLLKMLISDLAQA